MERNDLLNYEGKAVEVYSEEAPKMTLYLYIKDRKIYNLHTLQEVEKMFLYNFSLVKEIKLKKKNLDYIDKIFKIKDKQDGLVNEYKSLNIKKSALVAELTESLLAIPADKMEEIIKEELKDVILKDSKLKARVTFVGVSNNTIRGINIRLTLPDNYPDTFTEEEKNSSCIFTVDDIKNKNETALKVHKYFEENFNIKKFNKLFERVDTEYVVYGRDKEKNRRTELFLVGRLDEKRIDLTTTTLRNMCKKIKVMGLSVAELNLDTDLYRIVHTVQ